MEFTKANDQDDQGDEIYRIMSLRKEQFSNAARKQYRDQIFRKKRLQFPQFNPSHLSGTNQQISNQQQVNESSQSLQVLPTSNKGSTSIMSDIEANSESNIQSNQILTQEQIYHHLQLMKSQDVPQVRIALQFFQAVALNASQQAKLDLNKIRMLVDANIIFELIDLFQSTKDPLGNYLLPEDIAANGLYVLAIIASGDDSCLNSILNKNGLTIFKDYVFKMVPNTSHPSLYASAYLGLVNLTPLEMKNIRTHLKQIGMLQHLNNSLSMVMSSLSGNSPEYEQMISNGVWLMSVLCFDRPESEEEMNQLLNCMPFLIACLNSSNVRIMKDVIWIITTCLQKVPQSFQPNNNSNQSNEDLTANQQNSTTQANVAKHLLNLGLAQALNRTVQVDSSKVRTQSLRCLTSLMKLSGEGAEGIYQPEQVRYVLSVLQNKHQQNQYYALNYLNELAYQHRFSDFVSIGELLKELIAIIERNNREKFTQLILQAVLKVVESEDDDASLRSLFESGIFGVLETTLEYARDSPTSSPPQIIILSLQILTAAFKRTQRMPVLQAMLHRLQLENRLFNLQEHPIKNIYDLNLYIIDNFYDQE